MCVLGGGGQLNLFPRGCSVWMGVEGWAGRTRGTGVGRSKSIAGSSVAAF